MAMTSGAAAASADLDSLYRDLRAAHSARGWSPATRRVTPADMVIELERNGVTRQRVAARNMLVPVQEIVAYASRVMTLLPGDVIFTGAPPGVGPIEPGDSLRVRISRPGEMEIGVR
jgi:2-keto-4-pentenoate hydratase/2-oxohepta-3-ene-1,7-dioic acid hydratase in catechol pathway